MKKDKDSKLSSSSRRKAVQTIGASGVLAGTIPGNWTKPVVEAIILPAHAKTSIASAPEAVPPGCSSSGPCSSGMDVNILTAVVTDGGDLFVLGDIQIPAYAAAQSCYPGTTSSTSMASTSVVCDVIDNGVVIGSEDRSIAGVDAGASCDAGVGCLISCSVVVPSSDNTLGSGDCVTLRLTFNGACVCSGVTTVA